MSTETEKKLSFTGNKKPSDGVCVPGFAGKVLDDPYPGADFDDEDMCVEKTPLANSPAVRLKKIRTGKALRCVLLGHLL